MGPKGIYMRHWRPDKALGSSDEILEVKDWA